MKIYDCKCSDCKAEFQAVLEGEGDSVACPSCQSKAVEMKESEEQFGCGGSCGGCSGCAE